jgi:NAD+ kinase
MIKTYIQLLSNNMQIVIFSKVIHDADIPYVQTLFDRLLSEGINLYVYAPYLKQIESKIHFKKNIGIFDGYADFKIHPIDFVLSLGGDGTVLSAVTEVRDAQVPILGINLGRLGFLASVGKKRINEAIDSLLSGNYMVEDRKLLQLESNSPLFGATPFALNDFTLLKRDTSSMITINAYVNGAYLNSYWADGLIVATPTGSTGYSLSCGGPIIFPESNNFVITAVAPHNLNIRPVIVSDTSVVSFEVEGRADNFLCTLDSRFETVTADIQLAVTSAHFKIKLVQLAGDTFLKTIRAKLAWGQDARNH